MSKNISIQEGGIGKQLTVDKLKINLVGGGTCLWVPEDGTRLTAKTISEDGTYNASDEGYYGYSQVTVHGIGRATGKDPQTGEEKTVTTDPNTGELVETTVPVEIRITTPPTKTTYTHGETIDYSGIVVHAYSSTGQDMGVVPFGELVFPETTADEQKADEWTDGQGLNATTLYLTPNTWYDWQGQPNVEYVGQTIGTYGGAPASYGNEDIPGSFLLTRYNNFNYIFWRTGGDRIGLFTYVADIDGDNKNYGWRYTGSISSIPTINRFAIAPYSDYLTNIPQSDVDPTTVNPADLQSAQSIPVQWPRTGDGVVLETSFNIQVNQAA